MQGSRSEARAAQIAGFSKTRENMQNRVLPPKTSPIEQINDRFGPKFSPLRRVTLQDVLIFRCVPLFKTTKKIFDLTSYFPQKRTLWPGQSLSSPIRRRFFDPPNGAIRWMHQYVCILCVHLFNLSHTVHLLHLPHSIPVNCQKMVRNAYLF